MAHSQEGAAYFYENVGSETTNVREGAAYFYENVLVEVLARPAATLLAFRR